MGHAVVLKGNVMSANKPRSRGLVVGHLERSRTAGKIESRTATLTRHLRGKRLKGTHAGREYRARVLPSGRIKLLDAGRIYDSPSAAARAIVKRSVNGWLWWRYRDSRGRWASLVGLRMPSRRGG